MSGSSVSDVARGGVSGESVVEVRELRRRFGQLEAVKGVSFAIGEGEVFGFLGPNGAGKTTTINMLCTLLRPTAGSATAGSACGLTGGVAGGGGAAGGEGSAVSGA